VTSMALSVPCRGFTRLAVITPVGTIGSVICGP